MMAMTTFALSANARASASPKIRLWPTRSSTRRSPRGAMSKAVVAGLATALYLLLGSSAIAGPVCKEYGWRALLPSYGAYKASHSLQEKAIKEQLKVHGVTAELVRKLTPSVKAVARSRGFLIVTVVGMAIGANLAYFGDWLEDKSYCLFAAAPTKMEE